MSDFNIISLSKGESKDPQYYRGFVFTISWLKSFKPFDWPFILLWSLSGGGSKDFVAYVEVGMAQYALKSKRKEKRRICLSGLPFAGQKFHNFNWQCGFYSYSLK